VERSDTHHLSMRAARRWVSQGLNPSYELTSTTTMFRSNLHFGKLRLELVQGAEPDGENS
jgi:hypothetical protein